MVYPSLNEHFCKAFIQVPAIMITRPENLNILLSVAVRMVPHVLSSPLSVHRTVLKLCFVGQR